MMNTQVDVIPLSLEELEALNLQRQESEITHQREMAGIRDSAAMADIARIK